MPVFLFYSINKYGKIRFIRKKDKRRKKGKLVKAPFVSEIGIEPSGHGQLSPVLFSSSVFI